MRKMRIIISSFKNINLTLQLREGKQAVPIPV
jgi:hypothetical protein